MGTSFFYLYPITYALFIAIFSLKQVNYHCNNDHHLPYFHTSLSHKAAKNILQRAAVFICCIITHHLGFE